MEFTIESALSPNGMIGHSAYLLLVASMLMQRMLYLRLLVIASAIVSIGYMAFILNDPVGPFWETLLIVTNVLQITYAWHRNRRVRFSTDEQALSGQCLPGLTPSLSRAFLDCGSWSDMPAGTILVREGEKAEALHWLASGDVAILCGNTRIATVTGGEFIGESSVIGGSATATAVAVSQLRIWSIEPDRLERLLARSAIIAHALQTGLARDAHGKLRRANHQIGAAPPARTRNPVTLQALPVSP